MPIRTADFAGTWYPGTERECLAAIRSFTDPALSCPAGVQRVLGGIVPHAGWAFSGKIACNVIRCLSEGGEEADTVLIFGHHMHPRSPNLIMKEGFWETPFGELEIDSEITALLIQEFDFEVETATRHVQDNTIELQLPFVRHFLPGARIVTIGSPPREDALAIARRAADHCLRLGRKAKVIGSTDLTHYGPSYGFLPKGDGSQALQWVKTVQDRAVIEQMLRMDSRGVIREALQSQNACCSGAAAAAIAASEALGAAHANEIAYMTSYDVRPDSNFVGYVGIVYYA